MTVNILNEQYLKATVISTDKIIIKSMNEFFSKNISKTYRISFDSIFYKMYKHNFIEFHRM